MKITIDAGHNCYPDSGAVGLLDENICTKETVQYLIKHLKSLGHEAYDITPYGMKFNSVNESLAYRVKKVNEINSDLHLCIHYNKCNNQAYGTECWIGGGTGGKSEQFAINICREVSSSLGTYNRGIKVGNLYIPKYTNMPCVLVEGLFIDNVNDVKKYDANNIAKAIIKAITGQEIIENFNKRYYIVTNYLKEDSNRYINMKEDFKIVALILQ
ncbi:N-acetylmuramoyl-L-alanine amidase [Desnuesiella massiliensis]|uniref:N-acetylmuramoyl-L-alanine amidase n=1 Tax=Desnuesiella massiliensis TaxID=1650662 RepID=UPI0006E1232D|nr:N-acetylmuramoyl-L-alanine amidase [Desnuesiella massiliensis]